MTNKIDYPEGHPLHGQTVESVRDRAEHTSGFPAEPGPGGRVHLYPSSFAALVHEYKRLKRELSESQSLKREFDECQRAANEVARAMGMRLGDDLSGALEFAKKLRDRNYQLEDGEPDQPRLAGDKIFEVLKRADARVKDLEKHIDTASDCMTRTAVAVEESQGLQSQLANIEKLYTDNYGNAMLIHLGLVGIFGVPDCD